MLKEGMENKKFNYTPG